MVGAELSWLVLNFILVLWLNVFLVSELFLGFIAYLVLVFLLNCVLVLVFLLIFFDFAVGAPFWMCSQGADDGLRVLVSLLVLSCVCWF